MSGASGVVEGVSEGIKTTMCESKSQPVHACAGNPIPFSKVSGQVPVAVSDSSANPRFTHHGQSPSSFTQIVGCSSRQEPDIAHVADPSSKVATPTLFGNLDEAKLLCKPFSLSKASELDNRRTRKSEEKAVNSANSGANAAATADTESVANNDVDAFPACKVQRADVPEPSVDSKPKSKPGRRASWKRRQLSRINNDYDHTGFDLSLIHI